MFSWQPVIIQQRICLIEERIDDLDTPIQQAEMQEEHADEMASYYEELAEMLNNIRPLEDVGEDILDASEPYISVLRLYVDNWAQDRDAAINMEVFYDNVHSELCDKQDFLRANLAKLHIELATALDRKDSAT